MHMTILVDFTAVGVVVNLLGKVIFGLLATNVHDFGSACSITSE